MRLFGYTCGKDGQPICGAVVEIKDTNFQTLYRTESNEHGFYQIDVANAVYPFVAAVKDYGVRYLEYWCQNLDLNQDQRLDVKFDTLEIYGLHPFWIKGGLNALMVYFRPMSLDKFQKGERDIAPELERIQVTLDGKAAEILVRNQVRESIGDRELTAYLIHVSNPNEQRRWNRLDLELWDSKGNYGAATFFCSEISSLH